MKSDIEVTVNGVSYPVESLGEQARAQVVNLQFVEAEIVRLQSQLAVYQTARIAYKNALTELIPRTVQ